MSNSLKIKDGKINFACRRDLCEHSCCGPFIGISEGIESIDHRPFEEIVLTKEDYQALYRNGRADLIEMGFSDEMKKTYYKIALHPDGTCKALVNGRCSIHEFSPTLCKAFPFYFDMFSGLCAIRCEGFSDDYWTPLSDYESYFAAAKKMYEYWLSFYSKSEEDAQE